MDISSSHWSPKLFGEKPPHIYDHLRLSPDLLMFYHLLPSLLPSPQPRLYILHSNYIFLGPLPNKRSANWLTQIVRHLVGIPEIFHAKANDIYEILHKPEQLLGIWPYLQRGGEYLVAQIVMSTAWVSLRAKVSVLTHILKAYTWYNRILWGCEEWGLRNPKRKHRKIKRKRQEIIWHSVWQNRVEGNISNQSKGNIWDSLEKKITHPSPFLP